MTNFKGTKGKWVIDSSPNNGVITILSKTAYICYVDFDKEGEANALLISKAPEMLEMLESIINYGGVANFDKIKQLIKEATK